MAGPITTGSHPKALWPGVFDWFGAKYDEHPVEYTDLYNMETSTQSYEEMVQHESFGLAPVKPEGDGVRYDTHAQGYVARWVHVAYALGYIVTHEEQSDGLYFKVSKTRAELLAFSHRQTKENVAANGYNRGFDSNFTYGDGKELLATDHPSAAGDWSNELAIAADISEASIEDLGIQIMQAKNSRGLRIGLQPRCLNIPVNLWYEANRICKSTLQNDTANNAVNVINLTNMFPDGIKRNHYFTDPDAFFLRTTAPNGLICFDREIQPFQTDNDFDTSNLKAKKYERYSFFCGDPRTIYGTPGG